jgi:hypothetical protein
MSEAHVCECGHRADDHVETKYGWKTAACLTRYYINPTECGCQEYKEAN